MKAAYFLPCVLVLTIVGCPRDNQVKKDAKPKEKDASAAALKLAAELAGQATEPSQFRDALRLLESVLNRPETQEKYRLGDPARAFLKDELKLSESAFEELNHFAFSQLDAYYLDDTFLLRDAIRQLELPEAKDAELPAVAIDWIARRVLLHEQQDENLSAAWILRRGYGNALDRSLVFLRMMRQSGRDGFLVAPSDSVDSKGPWLVAVEPTPNAASLVFVDPRLARVVLGADGKAPASWKELKADPKILEASGFDAKQASKLELRLAYSEHEIAPRMHFASRSLENVGETLYLHFDPLTLRSRFESLAPIRVWAVDADPAHPYGRLRRFVAKEDGGADETHRQARFQSHRVPWPLMLPTLGQYNLLANQFGDEGYDQLRTLLNTIYVQYGLKPREMLLHGKIDDALARIARIKPAMEEADFGDDGVFRAKVAEWTDGLRAGYLAKARKDPKGQILLTQLWGEDQYASALLQPNVELPKTEKKLLTRLLMRILREPLGAQNAYVRGHAWEDKAERNLARGGLSDVAKKEAQRSWINARAAWSGYLDRYRLSAKTLADRMDALIKVGRMEYAVEYSEMFHLDLHNSLEAQIQLAEAQSRTGLPKQAEATLADLTADLGDAETAKRIRQNLETCRDVLRQRPDGAGHYRRRAELLLQDWTEDGNISWTARRAKECSARLQP